MHTVFLHRIANKAIPNYIILKKLSVQQKIKDKKGMNASVVYRIRDIARQGNAQLKYEIPVLLIICFSLSLK